MDSIKLENEVLVAVILMWALVATITSSYHRRGYISFEQLVAILTSPTWCFMGLLGTIIVFWVRQDRLLDPLPDFDATENKAHLVRAHHSSPVVSLSKRKYITKSTLDLEDLQQNCGGRRDDAPKSFGAIYDLGFYATDFLAQKSFAVLETLPTQEQPIDCVPLLSQGRLTPEGSVKQEKSLNLPRVMQINGLEQRVTKMSRYLGELTAQKWAARKGYSLADGRPFEVSRLSMDEKLDSRLPFINMSQFARSSPRALALPGEGQIVGPTALSSSEFAATNSRAHLVGQDQSSSTTSHCEKKNTRETSYTQGLTMILCSVVDLKHFGCKHKAAVKSLGELQLACPCLRAPVDSTASIGGTIGLKTMSAIRLPDGGHILSLSEKKIVRKPLKRKCRNMSVLILVDHQQHADRRREDAAKFLGAKRICRQLVVHCESTPKRIHRQHGARRWPFKQSAIGLPDGGHILYFSKKKIVRKTLKRKCRTMSVLCLEQHVNSRWEDVVKSLGVSVSTLKRISRQHGIERWPNKIRKKVWRPPDSRGENIPPPTRETLLTNGQIEVENNSAPSQSMATIPHTIEGSDDYRNLLPPPVDPSVDGHVYESINRTVPPSSDPALSQSLRTSPHTTGSLDYWRRWLLSLGDPSLEGDVFEFINSTVPPCPVPAPIQPMLTNPLVEVKAIYGDDTIKFPIPLTSGFKELKEEVSKTLECELGSLKVAYMDYSGEWIDWILMARDENVREYLELVTSLGNQVTKLMVRDKVPNTTNVCETCGCKKDHSCV